MPIKSGCSGGLIEVVKIISRPRAVNRDSICQATPSFAVVFSSCAHSSLLLIWRLCPSHGESELCSWIPSNVPVQEISGTGPCDTLPIKLSQRPRLFQNCAKTLYNRALGAYFEREADSPKLLETLETQSKGWKDWNAGSCLQSRGSGVRISPGAPLLANKT